MFQYPEPLVFGDVMADVAYWLRADALMTDVEVVTDLSGYEAGQRCVYIERIGGTRDRFYDSASLMFEARGTDYDDAYDICQAARALLWAAPGNIARLVHVDDIAGPSRWMDPVNGLPFYRFSMMFRSKGLAPVT